MAVGAIFKNHEKSYEFMKIDKKLSEYIYLTYRFA